MSELKYSRQREALLSNLKNRCDHPTADTLYHAIREQYPKISLGTVYRNLSLLCKTGEIARLTLGDGVERYDYNRSEHYHFVCKHCGAVIDLLPEKNWKPESLIRNDKIAAVDSHSLIFYGYCRECSQK